MSRSLFNTGRELFSFLYRENALSGEAKILLWSRAVKGIDDAILKDDKLEELTVAGWFPVLNDESREEVKNVWVTENQKIYFKFDKNASNFS
jgi:hypothetical protein